MFIFGKAKKIAKMEREKLVQLKEEERFQKLDNGIEKASDIQNSSLKIQNESLSLILENHNLNKDLKAQLESYEKRETLLKERENNFFTVQSEFEFKKQNFEDTKKTFRQEEILLAARKSEISQKESKLRTKEKELETATKKMQIEESFHIKNKEKYENLLKELEEDKQETKQKLEEAKNSANIAQRTASINESIKKDLEKSKQEFALEKTNYEERQTEIQTALEEKIQEYEEKIATIEHRAITESDIAFDSTQEGNSAKIVVKEALRQAIKNLETMQEEFNNLNNTYCEGSFKGFSIPIEIIEKEFEDLKIQYQQVFEHSSEYGLSSILEEWLEELTNLVDKADMAKEKWDFAESYSLIIKALTYCNNYEQIVKLLNSYSSSDEDSEDYDEDFQDYYAVLNIDFEATKKEIKKAYKTEIGKWHPDKFATKSQDEQEEAAENASLINKAYEVLSNENNRAAYDRKYQDFYRS